MQKKKSFKIMMLIAVNLAILVLLSYYCAIHSYAINLGENGERIAAIQRRLSDTGFYGGEINGLYDFSTRKAVDKFRNKHKIKSKSDYEIISALGLYSSGYECCCAEVELLAKHLKSRGIIEYQDMIEACEETIENSEGSSLFAYIVGTTESTDKIINAKPNSEHYSAALHSLTRYKNN